MICSPTRTTLKWGVRLEAYVSCLLFAPNFILRGVIVKKFTVKIAKKLTRKSKASEPKTFQDVIKFIMSEARNGHSNTFIDGDEATLKVIEKELNERGFQAGIERYLPTPFLSVYW